MQREFYLNKLTRSSQITINGGGGGGAQCYKEYKKKKYIIKYSDT